MSKGAQQTIEKHSNIWSENKCRKVVGRMELSLVSKVLNEFGKMRLKKDVIGRFVYLHLIEKVRRTRNSQI